MFFCYKSFHYGMFYCILHLYKTFQYGMFYSVRNIRVKSFFGRRVLLVPSRQARFWTLEDMLRHQPTGEETLASWMMGVMIGPRGLMPVRRRGPLINSCDRRSIAAIYNVLSSALKMFWGVFRSISIILVYVAGFHRMTRN